MSKVSIDSFQKLFIAAKESTDESIASSSIGNQVSKRVQDALLETLGDAAKAAKIAAQKAKLNFKYFEKKQTDTDEPLKVDSKVTVSTVVNWLLDLFKDVIDKINDQGELIGAIAKKLGDLTQTVGFSLNMLEWTPKLMRLLTKKTSKSMFLLLELFNFHLVCKGSFQNLICFHLITKYSLITPCYIS